ncbi:cysteine desulfurase family protein [Rummeliibacillus sp. TYF-LIM-RU47]|uniref:cysteine desulfurase family protein n=1 Tax=Rummeliibacillus sp. TYF-LIM-RU47 TaxID=2608406 RepID=UPI00123AAEBE|nr:cysteine desulfurase family protein [Rummeliibacillus sp. TYF-LIM-RU47]
MIYLDHSATTKPNKSVLETFVQANERYYANPASLHQMGVETNTLLSRAREQIAAIIKTEPEQIIFTSGGTESNNFAIKGLARANKHRGTKILISAIEHASVEESAKALEKEGYTVEKVQVNEYGVISIEDLKKKLTKDTVIVSIMHVNNEIGALQPISEIARIVHENSRAFFHMDAVQSFGKIPVHFAGEEGPDALTVSGHKINGLKGTGFLALRKQVNIETIIHGGGQEMGLRSGTVAVPQAVALAKAVRMAHETQPAQEEQFSQWRNDLHAFLQQFPYVRTLSSNKGAPHIVSCAVQGLRGEILVNAMQHEGFIISTSSACSSKDHSISHVVKAIEIDPSYEKGVIRISLGEGITEKDIQAFKTAFKKVMMQVKEF